MIHRGSKKFSVYLKKKLRYDLFKLFTNIAKYIVKRQLNRRYEYLITHSRRKNLRLFQ